MALESASCPGLGSAVTFGCAREEFLEYREQVLSCPPEAPGTWGTEGNSVPCCVLCSCSVAKETQGRSGEHAAVSPTSDPYPVSW